MASAASFHAHAVDVSVVSSVGIIIFIIRVDSWWWLGVVHRWLLQPPIILSDFAASVLQTLVAVASCCFPAFSLTDLVSLPDLEAASCEVMARLLGSSSPSMKACAAHAFATTHRFFDKGTHDVCVWLRRVGAAFRYSTVVTFGDGCC